LLIAFLLNIVYLQLYDFMYYEFKELPELGV